MRAGVGLGRFAWSEELLLVFHTHVVGKCLERNEKQLSQRKRQRQEWWRRWRWRWRKVVESESGVEVAGSRCIGDGAGGGCVVD